MLIGQVAMRCFIPSHKVHREITVLRNSMYCKYMQTNKPKFGAEVLETLKMSPEAEEMLKEGIDAYTAIFLETAK